MFGSFLVNGGVIGTYLVNREQLALAPLIGVVGTYLVNGGAIGTCTVNWEPLALISLMGRRLALR